MDETLRLWVPFRVEVARGGQVTQGSKRIGRNRRTGALMVLEDNGPALRDFRDDIMAEAVRTRGYLAPALDGPLVVSVVVLVPPYDSTPVRKLTMPTKERTGDGDKLLRAIFDGLKDAGVCGNDAQFVDARIRKDWAHREPMGRPTPPGALIIVYPFAEDVLPREWVGAFLANQAAPYVG
jgi:Holliday junction resolvase RusA-like endonuclease